MYFSALGQELSQEMAGLTILDKPGQLYDCIFTDCKRLSAFQAVFRPEMAFQRAYYAII